MSEYRPPAAVEPREHPGDASLEIIAAQQVVGAAPPDLPALRFFQRPAHGKTVRLCVVGDIGLHGRAQRPHAIPVAVPCLQSWRCFTGLIWYSATWSAH